MSLSKNIKIGREALEKSQEELAHILQINRSNISKWENGREIPSQEQQEKLACIFGVTVEELNGAGIHTIVVKPNSDRLGASNSSSHNQETDSKVSNTESDGHPNTLPMKRPVAVFYDTPRRELRFSKYVPELVQNSCAGILEDDGKTNRVSNAIALITCQLRFNSDKKYQTRQHSYVLVTVIINALLQTTHFVIDSSFESSWSTIKRCFSELARKENLPLEAKDEAKEILYTFAECRKANDYEARLNVAKDILNWIRDYSAEIRHEINMFLIIEKLSIVLEGAPCDYNTRSSIVSYLNDYFMNISIYDRFGG